MRLSRDLDDCGSSSYDQAIESVFESLISDECKVREQIDEICIDDESNDYADLLELMFYLHRIEPSKLIGSELLVRMYRFARRAYSEVEVRLEIVAEQQLEADIAESENMRAGL